MKKNLNGEKLPENLLENVQGGASQNTVVTHCLQCSWNYVGLIDVATTAQRIHSRDTGHNRFDTDVINYFE